MRKVSVIVPAYNVEPYIHRCVDSILGQTFTDFELILVDDGSPDSCGAICDDYAKKDNRITVIHKKNGGLSDARNAGLDVCKGEYILFVDSDDYIESDLLANAVDYLDGEDTIVSFGYVREDEEAHVFSECIGSVCDKDLKSNKDRLKFLCNELTDYQLPWSVWSKIYSRSVIEKYGIRFADNKEIYAEDLYFNLCYFPYVKKIKSLSKPMYHYLKRVSSITGKDDNRVNICRFEKLCFYVKEYYSKHIECNYYLNNYSLIYYKVMHHAVDKIRPLFKNISIEEIRDILLKEVSDITNFKSMVFSVPHKRSLLYNSYRDNRKIKNDINAFLYYADGNRLHYTIRRLIIYRRWLGVVKAISLKIVGRI